MSISLLATLAATPELMERRSGGKSIAVEMQPERSVELSLAEAADVAFPQNSFIIVHCVTFDDALAGKLEGLRVAQPSWVVVRFEQLANSSGLRWFEEHGVVPLSRDISNGLTVLNCYRAIMDGSFTTGPGVATPQSEIAPLLTALRSEGSPRHGRIVFGTLSLPRSGSKSLADRLVLWASPYVRVFHSHDLTDERVPKIERQLQRARETGDAALERSALMKLDGHRSLVSKLACAEKTVLFLIERNPVDRIYSSIGLGRQNELLAWSRGDITDGEMGNIVSADVRKQVKHVKTWYDVQYGPYGIGPRHIDLPASGVQIIRASDKATIVILRLEKASQVMSDAGIPNAFVSRNTAHERGYGDLVSAMRKAFPIAGAELRDLAAHPWLSRLHR